MLITLGRDLQPRARNFIFPFLTQMSVRVPASVCVCGCTHQRLVTRPNVHMCPDQPHQTASWEGPQ